MSFTSPLFYVVLVPAAAAFYLLSGRWRAIYLLALSYAFYALSSRIYLVLLIVASAARVRARARDRKERQRTGEASLHGRSASPRWSASSLSFKAAGAWRGLLLPLGVSYYSFKLISYLIEVYWDDEAVERDPVVFFLFPAFFPQIVSGPIQRPEPFFTQMREVMGRTARRRPARNGISFDTGRTDDEVAGRRSSRRLHRAHRHISHRLFLLGHADNGRLLSAAALRRLRRLHEHCARDRQAVRDRGPAQLPRAVRRCQRAGILAPLAHEPDQLGHGLSVHAVVDVVARARPDRARLMHHAEHADHRLVAWPDAQLSGVRRVAGHTCLRHGAHRDEPQARRRKAGLGPALAGASPA